jgi:hypothetical protein
VATSEQNARQLVARARRHVEQRRPRFEPSREQRERLPDGSSPPPRTATSASFKAADLRWANFTATKGRRATLRGADIRGALLTGAILTGAKFP